MGLNPFEYIVVPIHVEILISGFSHLFSLVTIICSKPKLTLHHFLQVADSALRCFACLADRFTRRGVDPAPLAKHGLSKVLLDKLASSALQYSIDKQSSVPATSPDTRSNAGNVSIVVSVLSTLCRGSPSVTHV